MILISNGLIKSGSTLFRNYTISLINKVYKKNAQHYLSDLIRRKKCEGYGGYVSHLTDALLLDAYIHSIKNGPIVIKCHEVYSPIVEKWNQPGIFYTYTIRDPRDVLLSAMDHGNREVSDLSVKAFKHIKTVEEAAIQLKPTFRNSINWLNQGIGTVYRYEDLIKEPEIAIHQLAKYILKEDLPSSVAKKIIYEEKINRKIGKNQFNKGTLNRYKDELSLKQIKSINSILNKEIIDLGYKF